MKIRKDTNKSGELQMTRGAGEQHCRSKRAANKNLAKWDSSKIKVICDKNDRDNLCTYRNAESLRLET